MPASSNPQSASSTDIESRPLALVTGVGPGTGAAVARRFAAGGYRVAILARDTARLAALEQEIEGSVALPCDRSEEHTSELQSLMRSSYAGFCLKHKNTKIIPT